VFRYAFEERPMTAIEVDIIRQLRRTLAKVWEAPRTADTVINLAQEVREAIVAADDYLREHPAEDEHE